MKRTIAALLTLVLAAGLVSGCESKGENSTGSDGAKSTVSESADKTENSAGDENSAPDEAADDGFDNMPDAGLPDETSDGEADNAAVEVNGMTVFNSLPAELQATVNMSENPASDFEFVDKEDGIHITKYVGKSGSLRFPGYIRNKKVVEISSKVFEDSAPVKKLFLDKAAAEMYARTKEWNNPDLANSLEYLYVASNVGVMPYARNKRYVAGEGLFRFHTALKGVMIVEGVYEISDYCFRDCSNLEYVYMANTVDTIRRYAFKNCTSLKTIYIPAGTATIEDYAFVGAANLTDIVVDSDNPNYSVIDGALYNKDGSALVFMTDRDVWTVPESLPAVTKESMEFFSEANTVRIPGKFSGVGKFNGVGTRAFSGKNITRVEIEEGVASIGSYCFFDCKNLTEVVLPEGLKALGSGAFLRCDNLREITLPDSVISIGTIKETEDSNPIESSSDFKTFPSGIKITYKGRTYDLSDSADSAEFYALFPVE